VVIGNNVTSIGRGVFAYCSSLKSIVIPDSVTSIDYEAFEGCNLLSNIIYKGSINKFKTINKLSGWNYGVPATKVICNDGEVGLI
jgi:hypothetical protein